MPGGQTFKRADVGPNISKGAEKLFFWLRRTKTSQNELARICVVGSAAITKVLHGDSRPGLALALALQTECEIPLAAWNEPASERFLKALRAAAQKKAA